MVCLLYFSTVVCYPILRLVCEICFEFESGERGSYCMLCVVAFVIQFSEFANGVSISFISIRLGRPRRSRHIYIFYIFNFIFASFILQLYVLVIDLVDVFFSAKLG